MKKSIKRLVGGLIAGSLVIGSPVAVPAAVAAGWCKPAPDLRTVADFTPKASYAAGGAAGYYEFAPFEASSPHKTRVSVFEGNLANYSMETKFSPFGQSGSQRGFASSVPNLGTYMNTDFIGSYNMPYSAVISKGRMVFAPPAGSIGSTNGSTRVIGYANQSFSESAGFAVPAPLTSGATKLTVAGVNLKSIPANSIVAYTPKAASTKIPRGAFAILVSKNKVTMSYLKGINIRPKSGVLFQATGTAVAKLKKFTNGKAAVYRLPSLKTTYLVADTVAPTGYVAVGTARIRIKAINYQGVNPSGATLYDSNFGGTQTVGAATFQTDTTGKVLTVSASKGQRITINPGRYIFQVAADQKAIVANIRVGQKLSVVQNFSSVGKHKITDASGRGSLLLVNGVNVEDCVGVSEDIRPRSVIGWNDSGKFWVATSTMGMSYNDGGYRLGGSTIHQMGDWLKQLGATEAVSFDGGGSTAQFIAPGGSVSRIDLPESEWIRNIPVGIAFGATN